MRYTDSSFNLTEIWYAYQLYFFFLINVPNLSLKGVNPVRLATNKTKQKQVETLSSKALLEIHAKKSSYPYLHIIIQNLSC